MLDESAQSLCRHMNGAYDTEHNVCIVRQSELPKDPKFDPFRECRFCGEQEAELTVLFNTIPARLDDVDVICKKCL